MRAPRLSRRRAFIAIAIVVLAGAAFYAVPRWRAPRPSFDEKPWGEALALLKAEVGAPAVEKNIFVIPKLATSVPYCGEATVADSNVAMRLTIDGEDCRLILCRTDALTGMGFERTKAQTAVLTRAEAAPLWRTLLYIDLAAVGDEAYAAASIASGAADMGFVDRTWPLISRRRGGGETNLRISAVIAARLAAAVGDEKRFAWSSESPALEEALLLSLRRTLAPKSVAESRWQQAAVSALAPRAYTKAAPVYRRIVARAAMRSALESGNAGAFTQFAAFVSPGILRYRAANASYALWVAENIAVRPEAERAAAAWTATTAAPDAQSREFALTYLGDSQPRALIDLCTRRFSELSAADQVRCLWGYSWLFGDDPAVAAAALQSPVVNVRAFSLARLHSITKKREHLDELMALSKPSADEFGVIQRNNAPTRLSILYNNDKSLDMIPDFLRELFPSTLPDAAALWAAGERGSRVDVEFLLSVMSNGEPAVAALPAQQASDLRYDAGRLLVGNKDPAAAEGFVAYLDSKVPDQDGRMRILAVEALGASGSPKALAYLETSKTRAAKEEVYDYWPDRYAVHTEPVDMDEMFHAATAELEICLAPRPADALVAIGETEYQLLGETRAGMLSEMYSAAELERLLADRKYARIAGDIYTALVKRREKDASAKDR